MVIYLIGMLTAFIISLLYTCIEFKKYSISTKLMAAVLLSFLSYFYVAAIMLHFLELSLKKI